MAASSYAVVIGGCNRDIGGHSLGPLVSKDSNPGFVSSSLGGVGRNIAHNMALLGIPLQLLTALGSDDFTQVVQSSCQSLGIGLAHALTVPGGTTSTYLYICDANGDMELAVSDMAILDKLTPDYFKKQLSVLNGAQLVITDTNIPAESLIWLCEHVTAPIFADPVSTVKAAKLAPVLGKLHTLKPNRLEAQLLSGVPIVDGTSLALAAQTLLATGLKQVFITLGANGIYAADAHSHLLLPACPGALVNATGCGDAGIAAIAWAHLQGLSLEESARAAVAAGSIAMESSDTINSSMCVSKLKARMNF